MTRQKWMGVRTAGFLITAAGVLLVDPALLVLVVGLAFVDAGHRGAKAAAAEEVEQRARDLEAARHFQA